MGIVAGALILFALGLLAGIAATVFDVLAFGTASFIAHVSLWVLVNAVFAAHVGSRKHAVLWAIPFNLGYIECYYLTTAATYEGYAKSLVAPMAAVALIAPLLSLALWTAKNERNIYGYFLTLLTVAGTLAMGYMVNGTVSIFDGVVCALTVLVIVVWPTRRFDVTRVATKKLRTRLTRSQDDATAGARGDAQDQENAGSVRSERGRTQPKPTKRARRRPGSLFGGGRAKDDAQPTRREAAQPTRREAAQPTRRNVPAQARGASNAERRDSSSRIREDEARMEERRRAPISSAERSQRIRREVPSPARTTSPLGTARSARPSTRTRR